MKFKIDRLKLIYLFVAIFGLLTFFLMMEPVNDTLEYLVTRRYSKDDCIDPEMAKYLKALSITMMLSILMFVMFSIYEYAR
jgi:hypothetical protein